MAFQEAQPVMEEYTVLVTPRNVYPITRERYRYTVHVYIHNTGACGPEYSRALYKVLQCMYSFHLAFYLVSTCSRQLVLCMCTYYIHV